jgi:hypothetical protein
MAKHKIKIEGKLISLYDDDGKDYISLTDIARQVDERSDLVMSNWLRNAGTLDFLAEWEMLYNPNEFKPDEFDVLRRQAGKVGFVMTAKKWIETTGAKGITSKPGRGGGTYGHKDIAFEFCSAVSARFKLLLIREFQELKERQISELGQAWDTNRYLSRINHHIHTDAIRQNTVPLLSQGKKEEAVYHASEVDLLNEVVFGQRAREWRAANPNKKKNMREYANEDKLHVLANLEALNSEFLYMGLSRDERTQRLAEAMERHLAIIEAFKNRKKG